MLTFPLCSFRGDLCWVWVCICRGGLPLLNYLQEVLMHLWLSATGWESPAEQHRSPFFLFPITPFVYRLVFAPFFFFFYNFFLSPFSPFCLNISSSLSISPLFSIHFSFVFCTSSSTTFYLISFCLQSPPFSIFLCFTLFSFISRFLSYLINVVSSHLHYIFLFSLVFLAFISSLHLLLSFFTTFTLVPFPWLSRPFTCSLFSPLLCHLPSFLIFCLQPYFLSTFFSSASHPSLFFLLPSSPFIFFCHVLASPFFLSPLPFISLLSSLLSLPLLSATIHFYSPVSSLPLSLFLHHLSLLLSFSCHLLSPPPQLLSSPTKKRNEGEEAGVMSDEGTSVEEVELSLKSQHGNNSYSAQTSSRRHSSTSRPLHPAPLHLLFTSSAVSLSCLSYCSPCLFLISIIRQGFQIFLSFFFSLSEFFMFRKEMLLERTQNLTIIK